MRVAMSYLPKIAKSDSVGVVSGILYAKGHTSAELSSALRDNAADFTFVYNNEGSVRFDTTEDFPAGKAFDWYDWDFVVINAASESSEYIEELCSFVKQYSPETKIAINGISQNELSYHLADIVFSVDDISAGFRKEMAEQNSGADINSGRISDFLCACVIYEMLTNNNIAKNKYRLPFVESEITEIIKNVVHKSCIKDR